MSKVKKRARSEADNPENSVDKSRKVAEMIRYCLFRSRKAVPLKRSDLSKAILSDSPFGLSEIYPSAREKMKKIFGMDLVEVSARTAKSYVLVNELNAELRQEFILSHDEDHFQRALLMITLTLVYMNHGKLADSWSFVNHHVYVLIVSLTNLWMVLKRLGIEKEKNHKELLEAFAKQLYLDIIKEKVADGPPVVFYQWGARASMELSPETIVEFVAEVYGTDVDQWKRQYDIGVDESD
eukprot:m.46092 g.46092  ORF g.46092 m.46092 type:complete len:239 (+) comp33666_c0_seq4:28-744(+)